MARLSAVVFLLFIHCITAQFPEETTTSTPPTRRQPIPDSAFLGKLGNLFLDFDEALGRYTAPREHADGATKEQLYDKTQSSRTNYFERIRENYKDIQKRVGSALGINADVSIFSDFLGVNVLNKDDGPLVDVSLPFLPMKLSVNAKNGGRVESSTTQNEKSVDGKQQKVTGDIESRLQLGNMKIEVGSKPDEVPRVRVDIDQPNDQARSSRLKTSSERKVAEDPTDLIKEGIRKLGQGTKSPTEESDEKDTEVFSERKGVDSETTESSKTADVFGISGRILGDVLYSESTFDKIMKRVIKDSMWLLDSDLSPSKAFERLNRFAKKVRGEKSDDEISNEEQSFTATTQDPKRENLSKRNRHTKDLSKEVENKPVPMKSDKPQNSQLKSRSNVEENHVLAFTLEGVPLKLKLPEDVEDPLKFLHKTLTSADVALNIPINSYSDLGASGKEVLQIGSGKNGMMARALLVDLSDSKQLKSLLKILRKFRSESD